LKVLSHIAKRLHLRRTHQADSETMTSREIVLFGSRASARYSTVTLWVTRSRAASLRRDSGRTECAQQPCYWANNCGES